MVSSTIAYYNDSALDFYNNTVNADMSEHYRVFEKYLQPNSSIIDAGCGSGRDSLYFLNKGYKVAAFDASEEMVKLSSELTGLQVQLATFDSFDFNGQFDGIWACASLLHVSREVIEQVLNKLTGLLKKDGIIYMSYKYGDKVYTKNGRLFNCYEEKTFEDLVEKIPDLSIVELYINEDVRGDRANEYWLSAIVQKR